MRKSFNRALDQKFWLNFKKILSQTTAKTIYEPVRSKYSFCSVLVSWFISVILQIGYNQQASWNIFRCKILIQTFVSRNPRFHPRKKFFSATIDDFDKFLRIIVPWLCLQSMWMVHPIPKDSFTKRKTLICVEGLS